MISAWWLLFIVPAATFAGFFMAAICSAGKSDDDAFERGFSKYDK